MLQFNINVVTQMAAVAEPSQAEDVQWLQPLTRERHLMLQSLPSGEALFHTTAQVTYISL